MARPPWAHRGGCRAKAAGAMDGMSRSAWISGPERQTNVPIMLKLARGGIFPEDLPDAAEHLPHQEGGLRGLEPVDARQSGEARRFASR